MRTVRRSRGAKELSRGIGILRMNDHVGCLSHARRSQQKVKALATFASSNPLQFHNAF